MQALRLLTVLLLLTGLAYTAAYAQPKAPVQDPAARTALEKLSAKYKAYKSYKATFSRQTEDVSGKKESPSKGILAVAGPKFRIEADNLRLYCDGKTLYTHVVSSKEVNVTEYDPNPDEVNPIDVFDLYKRGYKYMIAAELNTPTGPVLMIDLEPEDITRDIAKVRLVIDKKTSTLRKYIVTERGTNNRSTFTITSFTPNPVFAPAYFTFQKSKNAGVKVVDLR